MKILVHFPTRGRREQATKTVEYYMKRCHDIYSVSYFFACNDEGDLPIHARALPPPSGYTIQPFRSKIAAYNAIPLDIEWDIVVAASDDMWCVQPGWDSIIREAMQAHFPSLDGCLWFSDGRQDRICTMSVMGRRAYEADGYIYHPDYLSFFCDNEWSETWNARGKLYADPRCLFRNEHPAWGGVMPNDATYKKNDKAWQHDKQLYHERKLKGWPK